MPSQRPRFLLQHAAHLPLRFPRQSLTQAHGLITIALTKNVKLLPSLGTDMLTWTSFLNGEPFWLGCWFCRSLHTWQLAKVDWRRNYSQGAFASPVPYHHYDTAFIRDYYVTDCGVGAFGSHVSHNLSRNEQNIKEKLKVKFLVFDERNGIPRNISAFSMAYLTSAWYPDGLAIMNLFEATQEETLIIRNNHYYKKARYRWCFFFWVQTHESMNSRTYAEGR